MKTIFNIKVKFDNQDFITGFHNSVEAHDAVEALQIALKYHRVSLQRIVSIEIGPFSKSEEQRQAKRASICTLIKQTEN